MKITFLKILLIATILLFIDGTTSGANTSDTEKNSPNGKGTDKETTIKLQEEQIRQLEAQIKNQQEKIEQLQKLKTPPENRHPVEKALRESWNCCPNRIIEVNNTVVRIYFGDVHDIVVFFDTGPTDYAYNDLTVFLRKTGLKAGTVEYYSTPEKKLYSISGSLSDAKTKQYY